MLPVREELAGKNSCFTILDEMETMGKRSKGLTVFVIPPSLVSLAFRAGNAEALCFSLGACTSARARVRADRVSLAEKQRNPISR